MVPMYSLASFPSLINTQNAIYYTTFRDWWVLAAVCCGGARLAGPAVVCTRLCSTSPAPPIADLHLAVCLPWHPSFRSYEAWVIYNFMSLCLAYVGGPGSVETKMAGYVLLPSWTAFTCCLPPMPVNGQFVKMVKRGALQARRDGAGGPAEAPERGSRGRVLGGDGRQAGWEGAGPQPSIGGLAPARCSGSAWNGFSWVDGEQVPCSAGRTGSTPQGQPGQRGARLVLCCAASCCPGAWLMRGPCCPPVLQFVFVKPILAIVTVVLYATGNFEEGDWSPNNG